MLCVCVCLCVCVWECVAESEGVEEPWNPAGYFLLLFIYVFKGHISQDLVFTEPLVLINNPVNGVPSNIYGAHLECDEAVKIILIVTQRNSNCTMRGHLLEITSVWAGPNTFNVFFTQRLEHFVGIVFQCSFTWIKKKKKKKINLLI